MKEQRIGQNIAVLRKKSRTTQEQLAQVLHVSPQAVSKWEKGQTVPDTCTIPLIAEYFRVTIDFLYFGKAEEMTGEEKKNELRAKENEKNRLLYSYWKEDELNELTDEEFAVLQKKVNLHRTQPMKGGTAYFREFFGGKTTAIFRGIRWNLPCTSGSCSCTDCGILTSTAPMRECSDRKSVV